MSGGEDLPKKHTAPKDTFSSETNSSTSRFYLHHSDNPRIVLVTQPLTCDNYLTWNRAMTMTLEAKNKLEFVDGTINEPASNSTMFTIWSRCNSMVLSWILNALSKDIANSVVFMKTACDDELTIYNPHPACTCEVAMEISTLDEQNRLMQFLIGLNESYSNLRRQILLMNPLPNVSKALSLVLQDERQRSIQSISSLPYLEQLAMAIVNLQEFGRFNQQFRTRNGRPFYHCDFCGLDGHMETQCRKKQGTQSFHASQYRREFKEANARPSSNQSQPFTQDQVKQLLALIQPSTLNTCNPLVNMAGLGDEEGDWFSEGA
ncbi:hypothetical protein SLEP1_g194 [Rubroshorea leprosula]|uniref:Retrotransposon Copia-like N-terminal domain-containing protein n=1 Tax=Rubroshorea leprosula TaxID=152421 RepID=A0AAV5HIH0_9ROSI|nr:hypothetical protein SLEP1_g194 [Rubroshorea leprosula]